MKINKALLIISLFGLININSIKAQLSVKNSSNATITFCMGWYEEDNGSFTTKGWWNIEPGQTINPGLTFTSNNDRFYYYATSSIGNWEDKYKLLTSNASFNIPYADKQSTKNDNSAYEWKLFKQVDVTFGLLEEKKYTLNLSGGENTNTSTELSGTYKDKNGNTITITELDGGEKISYTLSGTVNSNCVNTEFTAEAEILRVNASGAGPDYNGPMFWYSGTIDRCNVDIEPVTLGKSVKVIIRNCRDTKCASDSGFGFIYYKN